MHCTISAKMKVKLRSLLPKKKASSTKGGGKSKLLDGFTVGIVEHTWKNDSDDMSDGTSPVDTSIETSLDSVTDMVSIDDNNDNDSNDGSTNDNNSKSSNDNNKLRLGSERTVLFHSNNLGIQLHRGIDGHVRVKSLTPTSNRHTTGTVRRGDVILEMAGVDIRTPIDAATWSKAVTKAKEAARPVTFVVAEELTGHAAEEMHPGDVSGDAVSGDAIFEAGVSGEDDSAASATSAEKQTTTETTTKTITCTKMVVPTREIEADLLADAVSTSPMDIGTSHTHTSKKEEMEMEMEMEMGMEMEMEQSLAGSYTDVSEDFSMGTFMVFDRDGHGIGRDYRDDDDDDDDDDDNETAGSPKIVLTASDMGDTNSIVNGEGGDFFTEEDYKKCNSMFDRIDVACSGFVCSDLPEKLLSYEDVDELEEKEG